MRPPQEIIRKKRDGAALSAEEIGEFIAGIADGRTGDAQIAAFTMAVFWRGMTREECAALTLAMRDSGVTLRWDDLDGPVADKHSTGGVGDLVSLVLGPLAAACGLFVPMISGRGLGHTGGTLDKLESIPGYNARPDRAVFQRIVRECGVAIVGQTDDLAPADQRIYAVRDTSGTVECIPLLTSSILSKKLAAGLGSLVMDVKTGDGAFLPAFEDSLALAESIQSVGSAAGTPTRSLITDMSQPLASSAGNAVEMREALSFLRNERVNSRLKEVTFALTGAMLHMSGLCRSEGEARARLESALSGGHAAERFSRMAAALGGPADFVERSNAYLRQAEETVAVKAERAGFVSSIRTRDLGMVVVELGGGRFQPGDTVDHAVGLTHFAELGQWVEAGDVLAVLHSRAGKGEAFSGRVVDCFEISAERREPPVLIRAV